MSDAPPPHNDTGVDRQPVSLRLSSVARAILARLSHEQGISQAAVMELLLRQAARENASNVTSFSPPC